LEAQCTPPLASPLWQSKASGEFLLLGALYVLGETGSKLPGTRKLQLVISGSDNSITTRVNVRGSKPDGILTYPCVDAPNRGKRTPPAVSHTTRSMPEHGNTRKAVSSAVAHARVKWEKEREGEGKHIGQSDWSCPNFLRAPPAEHVMFYSTNNGTSLQHQQPSHPSYPSFFFASNPARHLGVCALHHGTPCHGRRAVRAHVASVPRSSPASTDGWLCGKPLLLPCNLYRLVSP
jgi:hypothetical protein